MRVGEYRVDQKVLIWCGHMKRIDEYCIAMYRRILMRK